MTSDANLANSVSVLNERCQRLEELVKLQRFIALERANPRLPALVMNRITELMRAERGTIFLYEPETNELISAHADGVENGAFVVSLRIGVIGASIVQRRIINIVNAHEHPLFSAAMQSQSGYRTDSLLAAPIINHSGSVLGGVQLLNKNNGRFTVHDEQTLSAAAARIANHNTGELDDITTAIAEMDAVCLAVGCDRCAIFRFDKALGHLVSVYASGTDQQIVLPTKLGIAGYVALTGEPLLVADPYSDERFDRSFDERTGYRTRNILSVPLRNASNEILGLIQLVNAEHGSFSADDMETLSTIAGGVAIAFENRNMFRDIDLQFHSLLEVLAASLDSRDELTAGHSARVAEISVQIATLLGFSEGDLDVLRVAGLLHDYGKIGVDDAVLRKNGALTGDEYSHIKTHSEKTLIILKKVRFANKYRSVPFIASSHHESLDGKGYPLGLHDHDIPFMSKILSVADVYEALTADRHYRKGMAPEAAMAIINAGAGTKFDRRVVDALKECLAAVMGEP